MTTDIKNLIEQYKEHNKGLVWRAVDNIVYADNPSTPFEHLNFDNLTPIMDSKAWLESSNPSASKSASVSTDPLALTDVFYGPFGDLANDWLTDIQSARKSQDRSKAAAIITSTDYSVLQDAVVIGESMDMTKTGVLTGAIPEQALPNLKGEWVTWTDTVEYHLNVPEGQAVEPSKGTASAVEYTVKKGMGGVAITEYAQAMIHERDPFQRLIAELGRQRLKKENAMVADELTTATTSISGVDVGATSGTPPASTQRPEPIWLQVTDLFEGNGGTFNKIISKNQAYNEYINNDYVKGFYNPVIGTSVNESSGPTPGLQGVTWVRDNAIASTTSIYVMDSNNAMRGFRAGVRSFQLTNPKHENTEYYLKSFYTPEIVDQDFIRIVTGFTA